MAGLSAHVATTRTALSWPAGLRLHCLPPAADATIEALARLAEQLRPVLILGCDTAGTGLAHALATARPELPVAPSSPAELLNALDDKLRFTELARGIGLRVPRSADLADAASATDVLSGIGFPLVIKTSHGESGHGVAIVHTLAEAEAALARRPFVNGWPLQVQAFVEGAVLGWNVLARDGVVLAQSAYRKLTPERFRFEPLPALAAELEPLLRATGFSGLANFDAIETPAGPVIIEMNPRVWYNMQADALLGLNYVAAARDAVSNAGVPAHRARCGTWTMASALVNSPREIMRTLGAAEWHSLRGLAQALIDTAAARVSPRRRLV